MKDKDDLGEHICSGGGRERSAIALDRGRRQVNVTSLWFAVLFVWLASLTISLLVYQAQKTRIDQLQRLIEQQHQTIEHINGSIDLLIAIEKSRVVR